MTRTAQAKNRLKLPSFVVEGLVVFLTVLALLGCQGVSAGKSSTQISTANLALSSTTITFGNVFVGETATQTVTATNSGNASLTISSAKSSSPQFSVTSPSLPLTIAAGKSATLSLAFTPSAPTASNGTISVTSDASDSAVSLSLTGTGTVTSGQLSSNPGSVSFGNVEIGKTQALPVTLTNSGSASVRVSQASVSGTGFSLSGLTLPLTLAVGQSATFDVAFAPQSAGSATGNIVFTSDASNSTMNLPLSGAGGIPAVYFGQNPYYGIAKGLVPWPPFAFGSIRMLGTTTTWADLEPANDSYVWVTDPSNNILDTWLTMAQTNGITDLVYTFGFGTPPWISSNPTDTSCSKPGYVPTPGWCDPPSDVNADGTGTDASFKAFVTAIVTHVTSQYPNLTMSWECINEADGPSGEWTGTIAQTLTMCTDMFNIVKQINPSALVTTPAPTGAGYNGFNGKAVSWMTSYLQAGGGKVADVIAFHGYEPESNPELVTAIAQGITGAASSNGAASKPVWDTEMGYTVANLPDLDMEAAFISRVYLLQWSYGVSRFYWYSYGNLITGAMTTSTGALNEAGIAYGTVNTWMVNSTVSSPCAASGSVWTCGFTTASGSQTLAVWDASQSCSGGICTTSAYTPDLTYSKYEDLAGNTTSFTAGTTIQIGPKPILLEP